MLKRSSVLVGLFLALFLMVSGKGLSSCVFDYTDENGGTMHLQTTEVEVPEQDEEAWQDRLTFNNFSAQVETSSGNYLQYRLSGQFTIDGSTTREHIYGSGQIVLNGQAYPVEVDIYWDNDHYPEYYGHIVFNGQEIPVDDEEFYDLVSSIVGGVDMPNKRMRGSGYCNCDLGGSIALDIEAYFDGSRCHSHPFGRNCEMYFRWSFNEDHCRFDTGELGLGIVENTGSPVMEVYTKEEEIPMYGKQYVWYTRLSNDLTVKTSDQTYQLSFDLEFPGTVYRLVGSELGPDDPGRYNLYINGVPVPRESLPQVLDIVLGVMFGDNVPFSD